MKPKRTLVIGDIHGSLKMLNGVLNKANFNIQEDRIICVGDYIDGHRESFEVVRTLLEIKNNSEFENVFLLGNHDKWFLSILEEDFAQFRNEDYIKAKYKNWYIQGGKSTYESYLKIPDEFITIHKEEFFAKLKYFHKENNKLFVHAGFDLELGFHKTLEQNKEELIWNRTLYRTVYENWLVNQNLMSMNKTTNDYDIEGFDRIYIGHTPTTNNGIIKPQLMGNVLNVDQGSKRKRVLTAWVDETDEFYQFEDKLEIE